MPPLSATDAISPAFQDLRRLLFKPFRPSYWARLAVLGLLTGEIGGSGGGFNYGGFNQSQRHLAALFSGDFGDVPDWVRENYFWIGVCLFLVLLLMLVYTYVSSVGRFVVFDAVLQGRCEIRRRWRARQAAGIAFFFWELGFAAVVLAGFVVLVGVPVFLMWHAKWFDQPDQHTLAFFGVFVPLFFVVLAYVILIAIVDLLARDFVVPIVALEEVSVMDAWRRLLPMLRGDVGGYVVYILMKIVLGVGAAVAFGIADFFALLFLLIPFGILGAVGYLIFAGAGSVWNFGTIAMVVVLAAVAFAALLWVFAVVYVPGLTFFQSYALRFFGSRYTRLGAYFDKPPDAPPTASPGLAPPARPSPAL